MNMMNGKNGKKQNENEIESEYEEENSNEEFPDSEYEEEPETIGSLFDINELNSNRGTDNSNNTAGKDSSSQYAVKNWFSKPYSTIVTARR